MYFVPKGINDNNSTLVQIMAQHHIGAKPFPEPAMTQFTDTCVTRPQNCLAITRCNKAEVKLKLE